MGLHDRDWYHEAIAQKNKKDEGIFDFKAEFERLAKEPKSKPQKTSFWNLLLKACLLLGGLVLIIEAALRLKH